jgi:polysaccharide pyruvyl transferase WcaK-like protein
MQKVKKKKILIMTASWVNNLGDELILKEEYDFMNAHYPNSDIIVFTYNPQSIFIKDPALKTMSYFPNNFGNKPFANIGYFFKNIYQIIRADVLIIGWGGIIFDNEPWVSFVNLMYQWFLRIKVARISGTTILFWWISLEVEQVQNKMRLKKLFKVGDYILVRDKRSKWLLDALEIPSTQVDDIVFQYNPIKIEGKTSEKRRVGISVRWWFLWESERYIPEIYEYLQKEWYEPIFIIHTSEWGDDQNDSLYIKRVMTGRTYNVAKTIEQSLSLYPTLYAMIGMRYHATVLSCVHGIPCIPITYGPKSSELIQELELEHLSIEPNMLNFEIFQNMWHTLVSNYEKEQQHMKNKHATIRTRLLSTLETL